MDFLGEKLSDDDMKYIVSQAIISAEYLAQTLRTNTILTHLTLSINRITDHGLPLLADVLEDRNLNMLL